MNDAHVRSGVLRRLGMGLGGVALSVAVAGCAGGASGAGPGAGPSAGPAVTRQPPDEPELVGGTLTMVVHGLACPLCAENVDKQLRQVRSVKEVSIDLGTGVVRVAYDPETPPSRKDITDAVRWGGASVISLTQP